MSAVRTARADKRAQAADTAPRPWHASASHALATRAQLAGRREAVCTHHSFDHHMVERMLPAVRDCAEAWVWPGGTIPMPIGGRGQDDFHGPRGLVPIDGSWTCSRGSARTKKCRAA